MHIVLPSTGGSGADLPERCWSGASCWSLWSAALDFTASEAAQRRSARHGAGGVLLTLPLLWSPSVDWRLDAFPRLAGLWAGVAFYYLLLNCRLTPRQRQIVLWLIVAATLIQAVYALVGIGTRRGCWCRRRSARPVSSRSAFFCNATSPLLSCHRRRGAAVADGRRRFTCRSLTMESIVSGEARPARALYATLTC
jgi:O-antigen polymerase